MAKKKKDQNQSVKKDSDLWRVVAQTVNPLKDRDRYGYGRPLPQPAFDPDGFEAEESEARPEEDFRPYRSAPKQDRPSKAKERFGALAHGQVDNMDRRQAERFTKGKLPLEAVLDLHGMTQFQAMDALAGFLADCRRRGLRCVLVITGKGSGPHSEGVLRTMVPRWLNEGQNRRNILAFTHARPHHGGSGALYVLLKRMRER